MLLKKLTRFLALIIGLFIFGMGVILFPLPIPLGIPFMLLGLGIAAFNPLMLRFLRQRRRRYPAFDARLRRLTPKLPGFLRRFVEKTAYHNKKAHDRHGPQDR